MLRPLPTTRVANTVPGAALVAVGGLGAAGTPGPATAAGLAAVVLGAVLGVRGFRLGVDCSGDPVVVRGYLRDRAVPRGAVVEVTDFPAVRWRDGGSRLR